MEAIASELFNYTTARNACKLQHFIRFISAVDLRVAPQVRKKGTCGCSLMLLRGQITFESFPCLLLHRMSQQKHGFPKYLSLLNRNSRRKVHRVFMEVNKKIRDRTRLSLVPSCSTHAF